MGQCNQISAKDPLERYGIEMDFKDRLEVGESISLKTVYVDMLKGTDSNKDTVLDGVPTVSGSIVKQYIKGGLIGNKYLIRFYVKTSLNNELVDSVIIPVVLGGE